MKLPPPQKHSYVQSAGCFFYLRHIHFVSTNFTFARKLYSLNTMETSPILCLQVPFRLTFRWWRPASCSSAWYSGRSGSWEWSGQRRGRCSRLSRRNRRPEKRETKLYRAVWSKPRYHKPTHPPITLKIAPQKTAKSKQSTFVDKNGVKLDKYLTLAQFF